MDCARRALAACRRFGQPSEPLINPLQFDCPKLTRSDVGKIARLTRLGSGLPLRQCGERSKGVDLANGYDLRWLPIVPLGLAETFMGWVFWNLRKQKKKECADVPALQLVVVPFAAELGNREP